MSWGLEEGEVHRKGHDACAGRGHEGLGDFEDAAAAAAKLLPLVAAEAVVEALGQIPRQLYVLLLVLPFNSK